MILLFLFIVVPLAEIATFIMVGNRVGLWPTLAAVVGTAVVGTALLRRQGFAVLQRVADSLQRNRLPVTEVFHGACLLLAGALLLTPGFLTDVVGLAMFVPAVRGYLGRALFAWLIKSGRGRVWVRAGPRHRDRTPDHADAIDAEFVELDDDDDGDDRRR